MMNQNYWIGITDNDWYDFLKNKGVDEVNFWNPGGGTFSAVERGAPFLFKLHAPHHKYIVGGGFFLKWLSMPVSLAWRCFKEKNGTQRWEDLLQLIQTYRKKNSQAREYDPEIGCTILQKPFFLPERDWVEAPSDWGRGIQRGKLYDMVTEPGKRVWEKVQAYMQADGSDNRDDEVRDTAVSYGSRATVTPRLGQGAFRALVTDAYQYKCAISGGKTLPVLEAAHIKPVSQQGLHSLANGLLLRSDMHTLFDQGFMTVTPEHRVEVSKEIRHRFKNGHEYYQFNGKDLMLPASASERPSGELLEWHNSNVYEQFG